MKNISSKDFSEMLKQHNTENKVTHKKKLYNKITKEVKNLSMENTDRRKILNSYQRFLKKQSGGADATPKEENNYDLNKYTNDIELLTKIIDSSKSITAITNANGVYLNKIIENIKDNNIQNFYQDLKNNKIRYFAGTGSYNSLGYLLDFLNYWMMYINTDDQQTIHNLKNKLNELNEKLIEKGFIINSNQIPSDLVDLRYLKDVTTDKEKNLCALDNILSVLTLKKTNKAQLVNYNFIQDMEKYLSNSNIKTEIVGSTYKGSLLPGYDSYMTKYINVILDNLPDKPTEPKLISIYTSIMNKASTLKGKKEGMFDFGTKTIANVSDIKNIPEDIMIKIRAGLDNLNTACGNIQNDIKTLKNKLPQTGKGAPNPNNFNEKSVKALYHVFSQSALFKEPIESYYGILSNPALIEKLINNKGKSNTKKSSNGKELGVFIVENNKKQKFLSDAIFSKIAIGSYDDEYLPNNLTKKVYNGWQVQTPPVQVPVISHHGGHIGLTGNYDTNGKIDLSGNFGDTGPTGDINIRGQLTKNGSNKEIGLTGTISNNYITQLIGNMGITGSTGDIFINGNFGNNVLGITGTIEGITGWDIGISGTYNTDIIGVTGSIGPTGVISFN